MSDLFNPVYPPSVLSSSSSCSSFLSQKMEPDNTDEVLLEFAPLFRQYKSGRVERLMGAAVVPASLDPATGVASKDVPIDPENGVSARLYLPPHQSSETKKLPVLVYYHGGAFCIESAFSATYHRYLNSLASKANLLVVSVDYRLAPEHKLPAAYDDSWAALKWVFSPHADPWITEHGDLDRVFLAGDSAGANIAHHLAMRADVKIEGIALVHPYFWGSEPIGSETRDPGTRGFIEALWKVVNSPGVEVDDPRINATADGGKLARLGCRKVLVAVAEKDVLAERGRAYCEALKRSGWDGTVELVEATGQDHVFHLMKPDCGKAAELMAKMVAFFSA